MEAGYSKTHIGKKLGFHQGFNILLHNPPDHYFDLFEDFPDQAVLLKTCKSDYADVIHIFCKKLEELAQVLPEHIKALKKNGALWVSWPKGTSKLPTDLNRDIIREYVLRTGLVDVKVAAIDQDWSGLKFVYRLKNR